MRETEANETWKTWRCPLCGTPYFRGVLAPGSKVEVRCQRRRCLGHKEFRTIEVREADARVRVPITARAAAELRGDLIPERSNKQEITK